MEKEHFWQEALLFIFDEQGRATNKSLGKTLKKDGTQVIRCVYNLKKKGLVTKVFGKLVVTDFGKDKLVEIFPATIHRIHGTTPPPIEVREEVVVEPLAETLHWSKEAGGDMYWRDKFVELAFKLADKV